MRLRLELDRPLVHEGVDVIETPLAIALDAQAVTKTFIGATVREQVEGSRVYGLEDLELHRQLGDGLGIPLGLDQPLDLGFEVGDLLLVVVHPRNESSCPTSSESGSSMRPKPRPGSR